MPFPFSCPFYFGPASTFAIAFSLTVFNRRSYDLAMMALFNGKERKLSEWQDLFHQADQRFEFVVCRTNDPKQLSLIEFIWNGQS